MTEKLRFYLRHGVFRDDLVVIGDLTMWLSAVAGLLALLRSRWRRSYVRGRGPTRTGSPNATRAGPWPSCADPSRGPHPQCRR